MQLKPLDLQPHLKITQLFGPDLIKLITNRASRELSERHNNFHFKRERAAKRPSVFTDNFALNDFGFLTPQWGIYV